MVLENKIARGGTELMRDRIEEALGPDRLSKVNIIHSRFKELDPNKKNIYVLHDMAQDPEVQHLKDGGWEKFDGLVFVSHWQKQMYQIYLGLPSDPKFRVIQNATHLPDSLEYRQTDKVRIVYFSTPHRGLNITYAVFQNLYEEYGDKIELNVYSSYDLYGWGHKDREYIDLISELKSHPGVNYSKSVDNNTMRSELKRMHILSYPSIWMETSCLVLIESMMEGLICVHSDLGALPETSLGSTTMHPYYDDWNHMASTHYVLMKNHIDQILNHPGKEYTPETFESVKASHRYYSWNNVKNQWISMVDHIIS